jgi:RHS repeat-associated protein
VQSWSIGDHYTRNQLLASNRDVLKTTETKWGGTTLAHYDSTFDSRGLRQSLTQAGALTAPGTTTYAYNGRAELISADENSGVSKDFAWSYDLIGKRTGSTSAGAGTTYTSVADSTMDINTYASITGHHAEAGLTYDDDGNLTIDGTWHYTYDAENRLASMTRKDASQTLTFVYDYLGRRASKTVTGTGAKTVLYVWSGWRLAAELDGCKNLAKSYLWGADFSNGMGAAGGAGGLLAVRQGGTNYYPAYDNHGNIAGYVDSFGNAAATYEYNAFGQLLSSSGSADAFTFGYATQTTDRETGLVYYGLRYYNPKHGRFINRDPVEEAGGLNLYAFVGNQAGNAWDVLGLSDVILDPYIVTERRWTAEDEEWYKSLRRAGWTEEQIWWEFDQLDWVITNTQNQEKKPSEPPAPKKEQQLNDCYAAARAAHAADTQKLGQIGEARIESFFGSLAAQRSVANWDLTIGITQTVSDTALTVGGAYFVGLGASAGYARAAASTRALYSTARSWQEVNALARVAAQYQTTANYLQLGAGSAYAVAYHAIRDNGPTNLAFGLGGEGLDFAANNRFGQAGLTIGLTRTALDYIAASGLSDAQAAAAVTGIGASLGRTQQAINGRLDAALSECDKQFK